MDFNKVFKNWKCTSKYLTLKAGAWLIKEKEDTKRKKGHVVNIEIQPCPLFSHFDESADSCVL